MVCLIQTSLLRLAAAKMDECLKKGGDGRKFAVALQSLEYSGDLANQLMTFNQKMEAVFKNIQDLRQKKCTDRNAYEKFFKIIDEKVAWYTKAEASLCPGVG